MSALICPSSCEKNMCKAVTQKTVNLDYILPFLLDFGGSIIILYCNSATSNFLSVWYRQQHEGAQSHNTVTANSSCNHGGTARWLGSVLAGGEARFHGTAWGPFKWCDTGSAFTTSHGETLRTAGVATWPAYLDWMSPVVCASVETDRSFVINLNSLYKRGVDSTGYWVHPVWGKILIMDS